MKLNHLKHKVCPVCGARLIYERQDRQHCSGEWNETQSFKCGCTIDYSPNFSREDVRVKCPESLEEKSKIRKREEARRKLRAYIKRLDVDDAFRETLTRWW